MKKIIFDLDDTLYYNKELKKAREEIILDFLGKRRGEYLELRKNNGTIKSFELMEIGKRKFFELMDSFFVYIEKDLRLIKMFRNLNKRYKLVVLSNNSHKNVEYVLQKLGIFDLIDDYYSAENLDCFKPDQRCFFMIEKGDVCVGNNFEKDLKTPKQLGAITILLGDSIEADFNIQDIYELESLLSSLDRF